ncbi:mucoidy inhibitor MuiA family protein [Shimia ponticola]|uniref:mucoidy inhibitor MuiA family protein n=1 Tax=Shimia ponticola TaxID=2582893 RepID=UPI0011BE0A2A|nr:mucoidy inhibitor MuiA family protein [Shimia ponticola]
MRFFFPAIVAVPVLAGSVAADVLPAASVVTGAVIYPQGAEVTERFEVEIPAGRHQIVLAMRDARGLPEIALQGDMTLIGRRMDGRVIDPERFYTAAQSEALSALEAAETARRDHQAAITAAKETITALDAQIAYLKSARASGDVPATAQDLQATLGILGQELPRLLRARLEAARAVDELIKADEAFRRDFETANAALAALNPPQEGWARIALEVQAETTTQARGTLTSMAPDAGWSPVYDLMLDSQTGDVAVTRKAEVFKQSPGDWRSVDLILSTIVPSETVGASPVFPNIVRMHDGSVVAMPRSAVRMNAEAETFSMDAPVMEPAIVMEGAVGEYEGAAFVFAFDGAQTIAGGGGATELALNETVLDGTREIVAIPRRDQSAFVTARVDNTSGGPLIAGRARVYRDDTYFGDTFMDEIPDGAEAVLPFGSLESVRLSYRIDDRDEGDRGLIRRSNTQNERVSFEVENLGPEPIDLRALYALPVSEQEDLVIEIGSSPRPDAQDADGVRGVAAWDLTLEPGGTQTVEIEMSLTWPEGQMVNWRP